MLILRYLVLASVGWLFTFSTVQGQEKSSEQLDLLGKGLTEALKANDEEAIVQHFFSLEEVTQIMAEVNRLNGGEGVLDYEVDSVYQVFRKELKDYYYAVLAKANLEELKLRKVKFEEIGLDEGEKIGTLTSASLVLVMRYKKNYYMVRFPQSFRLENGWKIGAVMEWVGRVTK